MSQILSIHNVSVAFGRIRALDSITLDLVEGRVLGLIGPNGSGKSTLVNVLTGYAKPISGTIELRGRRLGGMRIDSIARAGLRRTFQRPRLLPDESVRLNVALGAAQRPESREIVDLALRRVGLADVANQPAGTLPMSRQRVIEVARALAGDPAVILLDEPTASMFGDDVSRFADLVESLAAEGRTLLCVEHDLEFIRRVSHDLAVLDCGKLIAHGPINEVLELPVVRST